MYIQHALLARKRRTANSGTSCCPPHLQHQLQQRLAELEVCTGRELLVQAIHQSSYVTQSRAMRAAVAALPLACRAGCLNFIFLGQGQDLAGSGVWGR